jgi:hypothetical protein
MKDIKNVRVTNVPVIDFDELECEFEIKKEEYSFYNRADQHEGYFWFGTDEDDIVYCEQEIEEYLETMKQRPDWDYSDAVRHLQNDLDLIKALRKAGYIDGVIIYIWC